VTLFSEALFYFNEPGALNESWSDVFGTMLERHVRGDGGWNWSIGEDCFTPGIPGDALRRMDDPHAMGDPDHYSERYTGPDDNGGVHTNSGISNKAFYLLAEGGTHHSVAVQGIGPDKAAEIWYLAVTHYMTVLTNFKGARTATLNAADELFGATSPERASVCQAWTAVGVGSACE
jgi:thermolysin